MTVRFHPSNLLEVNPYWYSLAVVLVMNLVHIYNPYCPEQKKEAMATLTHSDSKPTSTRSSGDVYTQQQHIPVTAATFTHNDSNIYNIYTRWQRANIYTRWQQANFLLAVVTLAHTVTTLTHTVAARQHLHIAAATFTHSSIQ